MKFRNPETGKIYIDILSLLKGQCDGECNECHIKSKSQEYIHSNAPCTTYCLNNQKEAAKLMGYEVVDDEEPKADSGNPTRESILEEAKRCVCNQREKEYGSAEKNFMLVASLWEHYIREKCVSDGVDVNIFPEDVAMMMALLKIARIGTGVGTMDSFVDLAGYAALGGEIARGAK